MKLILAVLLCLTGFGSVAAAQPATADSLLSDLNRYVESSRAEWKNVGVSVAVVRDGKVIFAQGFGLKESGSAGKVDANTLFEIGSTTKAFTAAALGMLVDEGKLHWDDPVVDYLPDFQLQDPWLTRHLTVRDALTHRSGIVGSSYFAFGIMDGDETVRLLRYSDAVAPFRDSYRYSNLMYAVAGKVLEAASGTTWKEFIRRRLLQPLGMKRSGASPYEFWDAPFVAPTFYGSAPSGSFHARDARDSNVAMPHLLDEQGSVHVLPWQSYDNAPGAGAIVSSAADMAGWLIMQLDDGRFEGQQLLKKGTVQELHAPQNLHTDVNDIKEFPLDDAPRSYAMGWHRAHYRGQTHLAHTGGVIGFPAYMALLPDQHIGVVVLSNGSKLGGAAFNEALSFWILDRLLKAPVRDWSHEYLDRVQAAADEALKKKEALLRSQQKRAPPSLPPAQYAGDYEDLRLHSGRVKVSVENGQLMLRFAGEGAFSATLEPWRHDVFRLRPNGVPAQLDWQEFPTFVLDPMGKVVAMLAFRSEFRRLPF